MTGRDSLRLPSYRSLHGRRYHPYPTARRYANNDEFYMDPVRDFDFEAAEHVLELPPSLQLHPARRGDDDDDDVTAFALDGSATKVAKSDKRDEFKDYVVVEDHGHVGDAELKAATVRPASRSTKLYALFLVLHYVRGCFIKGRPNIAQQPK
ncbi:hypothetical protein FOMPIDRAFT_1049464 [Fomitopsis schrenkii]|uniref:Uncharacterized protein n=1 Tax=Fomitopsis schrenkii TaxID=2126942 RepID=S8E6S7_FOMSC|nr:hypothetical protein FOMPIDRAFT_1049464 [Fomitopsis schrenkii]